jgi:hypothetical protein
MQALDKALLSATLWNYSPDNSNECGVHYLFLSFFLSFFPLELLARQLKRIRC